MNTLPSSCNLRFICVLLVVQWPSQNDVHYGSSHASPVSLTITQLILENCSPLGYYSASNGNYRLFVTTYRSHSWPLKKGLIVYIETPVRNCQCSPRNNPEERSSRLLLGGSFKSRNQYLFSSCPEHKSLWLTGFPEAWNFSCQAKSRDTHIVVHVNAHKYSVGYLHFGKNKMVHMQWR